MVVEDPSVVADSVAASACVEEWSELTLPGELQTLGPAEDGEPMGIPKGPGPPVPVAVLACTVAADVSVVAAMIGAVGGTTACVFDNETPGSTPCVAALDIEPLGAGRSVGSLPPALPNVSALDAELRASSAVKKFGKYFEHYLHSISYFQRRPLLWLVGLFREYGLRWLLALPSLRGRIDSTFILLSLRAGALQPRLDLCFCLETMLNSAL